MYCLVVGLPQLSNGLRHVPDLEVGEVLSSRPSPVETTKALRGKKPDSSVIVMVDTGDMAITGLAKAGFRVLALTGLEAEERDVPECTVLKSPFTINDVIASINEMTGWGLSDFGDHGDVIIEGDSDADPLAGDNAPEPEPAPEPKPVAEAPEPVVAAPPAPEPVAPVAAEPTPPAMEPVAPPAVPTSVVEASDEVADLPPWLAEPNTNGKGVLAPAADTVAPEPAAAPLVAPWERTESESMVVEPQDAPVAAAVPPWVAEDHTVADTESVGVLAGAAEIPPWERSSVPAEVAPGDFPPAAQPAPEQGVTAPPWEQAPPAVPAQATTTPPWEQAPVAAPAPAVTPPWEQASAATPDPAPAAATPPWEQASAPAAAPAMQAPVAAPAAATPPWEQASAATPDPAPAAATPPWEQASASAADPAPAAATPPWEQASASAADPAPAIPPPPPGFTATNGAPPWAVPAESTPAAPAPPWAQAPVAQPDGAFDTAPGDMATPVAAPPWAQPEAVVPNQSAPAATPPWEQQAVAAPPPPPGFVAAEDAPPWAAPTGAQAPEVAPWESAPANAAPPWNVTAPVPSAVAPWEQAVVSPTEVLRPEAVASPVAAPEAEPQLVYTREQGLQVAAGGSAAPVFSPIRPAVAAAPASGGGYGLPAVINQRTGRTVVFIAPKGGTGKSTLSLFGTMFLADMLATVGKKVAFIDGNLQQADAIKMLKQSHQAKTITSLVHDVVNTQTVCAAMTKVGNLDILFGPARPEEADPSIISPQLYAKIASTLTQVYDYVVVDTPVAEHYHPLFDQFLLPLADYLVCVLTPDRIPTENAIGYLRLKEAPVSANGSNIDRGRIGIVLNRVAVERAGATRDSQHMLQAWNWLGMVPEDLTWREATDRGEVPQFGPAARQALSEIWHKVTGEQVLASAAASAQGRSANPNKSGKRRWRR